MRAWISNHPTAWLALVCGALLLASLLQVPLVLGKGFGSFSGDWPFILTWGIIGLPFATTVEVLQSLNPAGRTSRHPMMTISSFVVLWVGMPLALAAGAFTFALSISVLSTTYPTALNSILPYSAALTALACTWALVLMIWTLLQRRVRKLHIYGRAFGTTLAAGVVAPLLALATGHWGNTAAGALWVSIFEQIASGLFLLLFVRPVGGQVPPFTRDR